MQRIGLLLPFLSLLFSGCASGTAQQITFDTPPVPESSVAAPGDLLVDAGAIRITIVDDTGLPLAEASAAVLELGIEARTDTAGWSVFSNLPPGTFSIAAAKLGYNGDVKQVTIAAEDIASVIFHLSPIPIDAPYQETFGPLQGYFACRASVRLTATESWTGHCGSVCASVFPGGCMSSPLATTLGANDNSVLRFNVTSTKLATIIGDMHWTQSSFATSTALRFALSHEGRNSAHWWCSAQGADPLQFRYELEGDSVCANVGTFLDPPAPTTAHVLRMYANTPFGDEQNPSYLTYEQRFEIVASVFYGGRAPETYNGFGDG